MADLRSKMNSIRTTTSKIKKIYERGIASYKQPGRDEWTQPPWNFVADKGAFVEIASMLRTMASTANSISKSEFQYADNLKSDIDDALSGFTSKIKELKSGKASSYGGIYFDNLERSIDAIGKNIFYNYLKQNKAKSIVKRAR